MSQKILMVLAPRDFRDAEYLEPKRVLEAGGFPTVAASWEEGTAVGVEGARAKIDLLIKEARPEDYAAAVFIGGGGMAEHVADAALVKLAQDFAAAGKVTAGICVAAAVLAHAKLLHGKKATSWAGVTEVLRSAGAQHTGAGVEQDGLFITADGPRSSAAFGQKILDALRGK